MFKTIKNLFQGDELVVKKVAKKAVSTRGRKRLSKTQKVLNLLNRGESVSWKT